MSLSNLCRGDLTFLSSLGVTTVKMGILLAFMVVGIPFLEITYLQGIKLLLLVLSVVT